MIKHICEDEYYPFYTLYDSENMGKSVNVSKKFMKDYDRIMKEFYKLQQTIEDME